MDSAPAWLPSGGAKSSAAAGRRGASGSPFSFQASTPAPESSSSSAGDFRFPRRHRLTSGAELHAVTREGKRLRTAHLDVRVLASHREHGRIGFIVAKHGHTSVQRNRVKRLLRELTRSGLLGALRALKPGATADIVVRTKPDAYRASSATLESELASIGIRIARVLAPAGNPSTNREAGSSGEGR